MEYEDVYENEDYGQTEAPDADGGWAESGEATDSEDLSEYDVAEDATDVGVDPGVDDNVELIDKIDSLIESVNLSRNYGSIADYYDKELGFTVFPDADVYEYFVDTDTEGHLWACASDNHYVPAACLEVYETYLETRDISGDEEEMTTEPTEAELETIEVLKDIRAALFQIETEQMEQYEATLAYQEETLAMQQETFSVAVVAAFFVALSCGRHFANCFFERMRIG